MEWNTYHHTRVVAVLLRYKEQTVLILMENQCCPFSKKYYLFLKNKKKPYQARGKYVVFHWNWVILFATPINWLKGFVKKTQPFSS